MDRGRRRLQHYWARRFSTRSPSVDPRGGRAVARWGMRGPTQRPNNVTAPPEEVPQGVLPSPGRYWSSFGALAVMAIVICEVVACLCGNIVKDQIGPQPTALPAYSTVVSTPLTSFNPGGAGAKLGSPVGAFISQFGPVMLYVKHDSYVSVADDGSGDWYYNFYGLNPSHRPSPTPDNDGQSNRDDGFDIGVSVVERPGSTSSLLVARILVNAPPQSSWDRPTAGATCNAFIPRDAKYVKMIIVGDGEGLSEPDSHILSGVDIVYVSSELAQSFPLGVFVASVGRSVTPGTFDVFYTYADDTVHFRGCILQIGVTQA